MDKTVQDKIDAVLDRIKDPQSGMTIAQMGLVEKIRHSEENKRLIVFLNRMGKSKPCCSVLNMAILADLEKELEKELRIARDRYSTVSMVMRSVVLSSHGSAVSR